MTNPIEARAVSAGTMGAFLATPVFETHVAPFLATQQPKGVDEKTEIPEGGLKNLMEIAHAKTEQCYAMQHVAYVSKAFRDKRTKLLASVAQQMTSMHEMGVAGMKGASCLEDLVDRGCYLRALRIYFYMKPQALCNFASNGRSGSHILQNILHKATSPDKVKGISESFVSFVLTMDRRHALGLSKQQDLFKRTPLTLCQSEITRCQRLRRNELPIRERMVELLQQHEAAVAPVSAGTMGACLATPVFETHVAPFLATTLLKQSGPLFTSGSEVTDKMVISLNAAHKETEQLYALLTLSRVSKTFREKLERRKGELTQRVVTSFTTIQEGPQGAAAVRHMLDLGWYLRAMRVYFFAKPQALHNFASDPERNEEHRRNVLHPAANPTYCKCSRLFVSFVLEMDRTHQLGLYKHKSRDRQTPLEALRDFSLIGGQIPVVVEIQQLTIKMLVQHEAAMEALNAPVAQPAQPPRPEQKAEVKQPLPEVKVNLIVPAHLMDPKRDAAVRPEPLPPKSPVHRAAADAPSLFSRICSCVYAALASLVSSIAQTIGRLFTR